MEHLRENEVIAEVGYSIARKFLLIIALFALGVVVLGLAWNSAASPFGRIVLAVIGGICLFQGERMRRAPDVTLQLTQDGLFQSDGILLARLDEIKRIDRGALVIKPSNGFILILTETHKNAWLPGLWWRIGKRVGVGGVVSAGAAKFMAEQIALMVAPKS